MSDFEQALIGAFKDSFPPIQHRGCFFHFCQSMYYRIQRDPALNENLSDPTFSLQLRLICTLAYVPEPDVYSAFDELDGSDFFVDHHSELDEYLDYFMNTWMEGFDRRGNRKQPLFPIPLWNCYDGVLNYLPKTNNSAEGFHNGFLSILTVSHPSLWKFVEGLLKVQSLTVLRQELFMSSQGPHLLPGGTPSNRSSKIR